METGNRGLRKISIAKEFSRFPAGRTEADNEFNGTKFRKEHLVPALNKFDQVEVNFDGVYALGSSFLEEAFGGLVREESMESEYLLSKLEITASPEMEEYVKLCFEFIEKG